MKIESIAALCHEANRRYCTEIGDNSQKPWEEAPWWQKQSAIAGVIFVMQHPDSPPSASHENWVKQKVAEGWKYGEIKDIDAKIHPQIRPYDELPAEQKMKDKLFQAIVLVLTKGESHE